MPSYADILVRLLPVFLLIATGVALRRAAWLTAEADASLLKLVVNVLYPALIFENILGNSAVRQAGNLTAAPLIGFGTMVLGLAVGYAGGKALGLARGHGLRTFAFAVGLYNYGYIPIPLVEAFFDRDTLAVLLVHNVGCEAAIWTVGILLLTGASAREGWRKLVNAPVLSLALALLLNAFHLAERIPAPLLSTLHALALCAVPIGLLLIGANLADHLTKPAELADARILTGSCLLRLGLLPLAGLALAKLLPVSPELKRVMLVQAAMPAAVLPIVIARHYGGQPRVAVQVVLGTTLVGILAIPLWLRLGFAWLGKP